MRSSALKAGYINHHLRRLSCCIKAATVRRFETSGSSHLDITNIKNSTRAKAAFIFPSLPTYINNFLLSIVFERTKKLAQIKVSISLSEKVCTITMQTFSGF